MPGRLHEKIIDRESAKYPLALPKGTRLPKCRCPDKRRNKRSCIPDRIVRDANGRWWRIEVDCKGAAGPCRTRRQRIRSPFGSSSC